MPEPIPSSGAINADLIRTNWFRSGQFSLGSYRNLQVWDETDNPDNTNIPYGIRNLPSPTIKFSDFRGKVEMYAIDYCIISGGGGGGTPITTTGGVFTGYAGGGGGGGTVKTGTTYVPNGGNLSNWNRLDIVVGGGGAGGGTSNNGRPFNGAISYIKRSYTLPIYTQILEEYITSKSGGAGASINYLAGSNGSGGGGSSFGYLNQGGNPPGFGEVSSGGWGQGIYFSINSYQSLAGGGGAAGGNGNTANISSVKAGQGGAPVELSNFLGTDPSPYLDDDGSYRFGAQNRAGGGGGGGAYSIGGDVNTYDSIRAAAQLGGGGAGAAESEPGSPADNASVHGYVSAENGKNYRGGGGGGGAGSYVYNAGSGGSGSVIIRYRNIDNNQRGVGGDVYNVSINGINYYTHIFYGSGSFYFYG